MGLTGNVPERSERPLLEIFAQDTVMHSAPPLHSSLQKPPVSAQKTAGMTVCIDRLLHDLVHHPV